MARKVIKLSSLDMHAPPDVEIVFRIQMPNGRRPPRLIGDYDCENVAQEVLDRNRGAQYVTWWRRDGKHVQKWPTMMSGKARHFRVTVPYVKGVSDTAWKQLIHDAVYVRSVSTNKDLKFSDVKVAIDAERNRGETRVALWAVVEGETIVWSGTEEECNRWAADPPPGKDFAIRKLVFGD